MILALLYGKKAEAMRMEKNVEMKISISGKGLSELINFFQLTTDHPRAVIQSDKSANSLIVSLLNESVELQTRWDTFSTGMDSKFFLSKAKHMSFGVTNLSCCYSTDPKSTYLVMNSSKKFKVENETENKFIEIKHLGEERSICIFVRTENKTLLDGLRE